MGAAWLAGSAAAAVERFSPFAATHADPRTLRVEHRVRSEEGAKNNHDVSGVPRVLGFRVSPLA